MLRGGTGQLPPGTVHARAGGASKHQRPGRGASLSESTSRSGVCVGAMVAQGTALHVTLLAACDVGGVPNTHGKTPLPGFTSHSVGNRRSRNRGFRPATRCKKDGCLE